MITELQETLHGIERLYSISYIWYVLLGMVLTVVIGLAVSLIFSKCYHHHFSRLQ